MFDMCKLNRFTDCHIHFIVCIILSYACNYRRGEIHHVTIRSRSPTTILAGHHGEDKIPDGATRKDRPLEMESAIL